MPRKSASHSGKKDTAVESKNDSGAPRRSGRAATKQETSSLKEATRSRRSSTAAQTAASVADSKSPKGRTNTNSNRDSSPSDNRSRSSRESGLETPATRVKSTRRTTGRVNYKESDGEEEVSTPKNDENFDSDEEYEESDSDEKSKPKGKARSAKSSARGRGTKDKAKGPKGRRGRPTKKKSYEEDSDAYEISDDSRDADEPPSDEKKDKGSPVKDHIKSNRGRKPKVVVEDKPKSSRRSTRTSINKEEPENKRPTRSIKAKRYTEDDDDDDDIEEIDSKADEDYEEKPASEETRKRKRSSATKLSKRLKEDVESESEESNGSDKLKDSKEMEDISESKSEDQDTKTSHNEEEHMEIDEGESANSSENDSKLVSDKSSEQKETLESSKNSAKKEIQININHVTKEKQESFRETSDHKADKINHSSSDIEESKDYKKEASESNAQDSDSNSQIDDNLQKAEKTQETKNLQSLAQAAEQSMEKFPNKIESNIKEKGQGNIAEEKCETKSFEVNKAESNTNLSSSSSKISHSNDQVMETAINGAEKTPVIKNPTPTICSTGVIFENKENPSVKANGAHESLHGDINQSYDDNCYPFPGRKYICNPKLSENARYSYKERSFGFLSYNLTSSDMQKDKLLHELDKLQAHIICLQQVSKQFFQGILEPSLDALGFKGVFSQPEDNLKGIATFFKSTCFRLNGFTEYSLKKLIEKEIETSSLDANDKTAVRSHLKKCGNVLFTQLSGVKENQVLTVANAQIPHSDLSIHALQVSCLAREIVSFGGGANKPLLLCGEFNMLETEAPYQLLKDGYLSNDMIEVLQQKKDIAIPGKENAALVNLLWKAFQHPSSNFCSCYASVLDHELLIPEQKSTSPDLLWYSSDSLVTLSILDVVSDKLGDSHFSLKADLAFSI